MWMFRALKQMTLGRLVRKVEARANNGSTDLTLSLKQETGDGDYFVVLSMKSAGNRQYAHLSRPEFEQFSASVASIREDLATRKTGQPGR